MKTAIIAHEMSPEWSSWPKGECGYNLHPDDPHCPICDTKLRTVEVVCSFSDGTLYKAVCTQCRTHYLYKSSEDITLEGIDELALIDTLLEKISLLQSEVTALKQQHHAKHQNNTPTPPVGNELPDNLRFLLS